MSTGEGADGTTDAGAVDTGDVLPNAFAFFSLAGDRFDAPGMPAETVREVGYFRDAVLDVARHVWLAKHPDRQRVPRGFADAFDLRLLRVDAGSARPQLVLHRPAAAGREDDWDEWAEVFATARDLVADAIGSLNHARTLPPAFPEGASRSLRSIGGSLREAESITLGSPVDKSRRAIVDTNVRALLEDIDEVTVLHQSIQLEGVIVEYDGETLTFRMKTDGGVAVCGLETYNATLVNRVKDNLALDGVTAPDVRIEGETLDPAQRQLRVFNVHTIEVVRSVGEKVLVHQLRRIGELEPGWYGADSEAPSPDARRRVERLVPLLASLGEDVRIFPNADGAIVLEWRRGDVEMTATVESNGDMFLCADNTRTDQLLEDQAEFDEARLRRFIERGSMQ